MKIVPGSFYERDTVTVARALLGKRIIRTLDRFTLSGIITQTEAYCFSNDPASHAYRGKTKRNAAMFGPVGHAYVYFIYGNHFCFNIVARKSTMQAGAVLIRAIEPLKGIDLMHKHRGKKERKILTDGPGKLAQALGITTSHNGVNLVQQGQLYVTEGDSIDTTTIYATPRIGISVGQDKLWRFCLK